jgi:hypothetical protein
MAETTQTTSNYTGKIEWNLTDTSGLRVVTDDGDIGGKTNFIDSGSVDFGVNEVWYGSERIDPLTLLVVDFSYLPINAPGGMIHAGFTNIKALNIRNISGDLVYIGDSGTTYGIGVFGERQTLGISGVAGWEGPTGRSINSSQHNIGIYNPSSTEIITTSIGVVGNPEILPISGSYNDDFSDDFQYIINA